MPTFKRHSVQSIPLVAPAAIGPSRVVGVWPYVRALGLRYSNKSDSADVKMLDSVDTHTNVIAPHS